jgi:hypothetical protein
MEKLHSTTRLKPEASACTSEHASMARPISEKENIRVKG